MKKIKVLEIVPNMQQGGLENLVMNIIRNIDMDRFEIHFLYHYTGDYFFDEEIKKLGGIIHKCSFREDKNIFKYLKFLNTFFFENHFDVVHSHMLSTSFFTMKYAKKWGCKNLINHAHNSTTEKSIKGFVKGLMIKISSIYANTFLACSEESGKFAYGKKKFIVIDNCINLDRFKFSNSKRDKVRKKLNIKDDEILFGNIGRLNVQKNQLFLIDVFSKLQLDNNKLLIIGFGELKDAILDKVKNLNLNGKIIMLENIKDTEAYYSAMDCFLLPSKFEGFPLTAVEAQANGVPCLFSSTISKSVELNSNVKFISIEDEDGWVRELDCFNLERQSELSDKIKKFDVKFLVKVVSQLYEKGIN